jgi:putative transposase
LANPQDSPKTRGVLSLKEEEKLEIAKFRFGIISDFVTGVRFHRGEREKLLRKKCARKYTIPFSSRTTC